MNKLTIAQKQSNSGSIHDISSDRFERTIKFCNKKFAVVLASYYGGKGYTVHSTAELAIEQARKNRAMGYSQQIIDAAGNYYDRHGGELLACGGGVKIAD